MSASPLSFLSTNAVDYGCQTKSARVSFDFEAASFARCTIEGEREFSILVTPEHYPPINPSPWYAFRYEADSDVIVNLRYLGAEHRYPPIWTDGQLSQVIEAKISEGGRLAQIDLPAGRATVSAQPIFDSKDYKRLLRKLDRRPYIKRETIGRSHDGRKIEALMMGDESAPNLIVLLGRQHPPEVTGAIALEAFLDELGSMIETDEAFRAQFQVLAVPQLNPDGVARGHWRANLGGRDTNRDWGYFSQPETAAVRQQIEELAASTTPVLSLDFHSTHRNLFYVQGEDELDERQEEFLIAWLSDQTDTIDGYSFSIERISSAPDSGTTKNWFHRQFGIPAYTYEVGDLTDPAKTQLAARQLARSLKSALAILAK